ncbi:NUDIX hydrolase [Nocardioides marmoraquaticus]
MSLHDRSRTLLAGWHAPGPEQEALRAAYVAHLDAHPDGTWRSCVPAHLTASTLVLSPDGGQVLLQLHAKARRWFQLGGHLEPGDASLAAAALREATEESGLGGLALDPEPVQLSRHEVGFCSPDGPVDHLDVRFVARAAGEVVPVVNEESLALRWWPADDLPTDDPDVLELVDLARAR